MTHSSGGGCITQINAKNVRRSQQQEENDKKGRFIVKDVMVSIGGDPGGEGLLLVLLTLGTGAGARRRSSPVCREW